jgi:hypothetical protein
MSDEQNGLDLSIPEDVVPGLTRQPAVSPPKVAPAPAPLAPAPTPYEEFRGIGAVHLKDPIACVVEVAKKIPDGPGWKPIRPFTAGVPETAQWSFVIMTAAPTTMISRGGFQAPARTIHPAFALFNSQHPDKTSTLRCRIIHWRAQDCWRFHLGAYQAPRKGDSPPSGWWCRGNAKEAIRWIDGQWQKIVCPARACEYQQEHFGAKGDMPWCKPNLTLIAQFAWPAGNPLPKQVFQWESKSWNNYGSAEGMFSHIREMGEKMGIKDFPVIGLPFTMTIAETRKKQRRYPEVRFSVEGDLMEWMGKVTMTMQRTGEIRNEPLPLNVRPALGFSAEEMERATQATLDPHYRPANERAVK